MFNAPLLQVSALFFLSLSALFYVVAWFGTRLFLHLSPQASAHRRKSVLSLAIFLPAVAAALLTAGGAFFKHIHEGAQIHHDALCGDMVRILLVPEGNLPLLTGMALEGGAWLLLLWGVWTLFRMVYATICLEREMIPYLRPPSAKLAAALTRIGSPSILKRLQFFEADIPMTASCLLGVARVRGILSRELVDSCNVNELDAVLAHEIQHFSTGDVWRTLIVGALNCLYCSFPPVRLLSRRWREETELACDAAAVQRTGEPLALAAAILRTQGVTIPSRSLPTITLGFAEEASCAPDKRVKRLISYAEQSGGLLCPPAMDAGAWIGTLILTGLGVCFLLSPQALCLAHCSLEAIERLLR